MSMTNSLYIGASGMRAHGDAISVIGDNIANASTIGYKRNRASFNDLLGGEMGAQRLGGGVFLGGTQTIYEQGSIMQTGNPLDMALSGNGMFVVKGDAGGQNGQYYTRDGRFQLNNTGFVVNQNGQRLQGYPIATDGTQGTGYGDMQFGGRTSPAIASTRSNITMNLDSNQGVVAAATAFDPTDPDSYSYSTEMTMHDSLGNEHTVQMYYRNNGSGSWDYHAMVDGGDVTGGTAGTLTEIGTGTLAFDGNGTLVSGGTGSVVANFVNATGGQTMALNFGGDPGTTQVSGANTVSALDIDGRSAGTLQDLVVNGDGTIEGIFDNGERIKLARVAIADFASNEGLERVGNGLVSATTASGVALIDAAGTGSRGSIVAGALEGSNVDLGEELVTLIAYQRAFQANGKTVTTADEMMAEVNNLKR